MEKLRYKALVFCLFFFLDAKAKDDLNSMAKALCQRDGYTSGYYNKGAWCLEFKGSIDDLIKRRVNLGPSELRPVVPFRKDNESNGKLIYNFNSNRFEDSEE